MPPPIEAFANSPALRSDLSLLRVIGRADSELESDSDGPQPFANVLGEHPLTFDAIRALREGRRRKEDPREGRSC